MQKGSDVVSKSESLVQGGSGKEIIAKDITEHHRDGSSTTIREDADLVYGSVHAGRITGVTQNSPDGKSTYKKK